MLVWEDLPHPSPAPANLLLPNIHCDESDLTPSSAAAARLPPPADARPRDAARWRRHGIDLPSNPGCAAATGPATAAWQVCAGPADRGPASARAMTIDAGIEGFEGPDRRDARIRPWITGRARATWCFLSM